MQLILGLLTELFSIVSTSYFSLLLAQQHVESVVNHINVSNYGAIAIRN